MVKIRGIYKITNKINGRFYIGCSVDLGERWKEHMSGMMRNLIPAYADKTNTKMIFDYKQYGIAAFSFEIIETCNGVDREIMLIRESEYIKKLQPFYNIQGK